MRIVLHNPHISPWYKVGVGDIYNRVRSVQKYSYIFDFLYNRECKVYVYIDNIATSLSCGVVEFWTWVFINKFNPFKFVIITDLQKLTSNDVFITFIYRNFATIDGKMRKENVRFIESLRACRAYKVAQLSHYGYHTAMGSNNAKEAKIDLLVSESNLSKNSSYFRYHYGWYEKDVYVMPFVPKDRFQVKTDFSLRKRKALATGTLTYPIDDENFTSFFGGRILQPMRKEIYANSELVKEKCDSFISDASEHKREGGAPVKKWRGYNRFSGGVLWEIKKRARLALYILRIYFTRVSQRVYQGDREYMKFDIVGLYNKYMMFVNPEEIIGLPGIGFVEGMACGCAYIGLDSSIYSDIGMKKGVHYIAYDGTLSDLCDKISYYQENEDELEEIAGNGKKFIRDNNDPIRIMKSFLQFLSFETQNR